MRARTFISGLLWWSLTILTLLLLDDLIFGWIFWTLSLVNQQWATVAAFSIPIATQQWLIRQGVTENPSKLAANILKKLSLERKTSEVGYREERLKAKAAHYTGAALVAPLIGGVIPTLILYKEGYPKQSVLRFSWIPTLIYATEYALLHGGWGFGGILRAVLL